MALRADGNLYNIYVHHERAQITSRYPHERTSRYYLWATPSMTSRYQATYTGAQRCQISPNSPGLPPPPQIFYATGRYWYWVRQIWPLMVYSILCRARKATYGRIWLLLLCRHSERVGLHMVAYGSFPCAAAMGLSGHIWSHMIPSRVLTCGFMYHMLPCDRN